MTFLPVRQILAFSLLALVVSTGSPADAAMLWYNGDYDNRDALSNGSSGVDYNGAKLEVSKVYENFVVPLGQTWTITSVYSVNEIYNYSGLPVTTASWEIRTGVSAGNGGTIKASGDTAATVTGITENQNYTYSYAPVKVAASVPSVVLTAGTYWLSVIADDKTAYLTDQSFVETTSGLNSVGTPGGNDGNSYISNNLTGAGAYNFTATSSIEGAGNWDYVMGVDGTFTSLTTVPEPSSLVLVALGGLGAVAFSRARSRKSVA